MRKTFLSKILISVLVLVFFLAPVSTVIQKKGGQLLVKNKINLAEAAIKDDFKSALSVSGITSGSADVNITLQSTRDGAYKDYASEKSSFWKGSALNSPFKVEISKDNNFSIIKDYYHTTWKELGYDNNLTGITLGSIKDSRGYQVDLYAVFGKLEPETNYYVRFVTPDENGKDVAISNIEPFKTLKTGEGSNPKEGGTLQNTNSFFDCSRFWTANIFDLPCQLTRTSYYLVLVPIAWVAGFAAHIMDFFIFYSTRSSSYSSSFINDAWRSVRDIANLFFIIALLYIAIKTILGLNITDNKKLLGSIIIVALLINFSLFFTQVIIDGSNILAKVFYNNINAPQSQNKVGMEKNTDEKSISVGLVATFKPQDVFNNAGIKKMQDSLALFFLVCMLMSVILGYMIYMFISISLLFVARVIGLWLAMIFSPLAFASYTVSFPIPGFGHKKWWEDLLKQAFLAPIFIFFLLIIYKFSNFIASAVKGVTISNPDQTGMEGFMAIVIPMLILFMLLTQAKKLAVEYSGEIGSQLSKMGAAVGGLALGAATGGAALLGTKTLGALGSKIASSEGLKEAAQKKGMTGWIARKSLKTADYTSKASFDARKTAAGSAFASKTGLNLESSKMIGLGSKEGGLKGAQDREVQKIKKESELYKTTKTDEEVKAESAKKTTAYDYKMNEAMQKEETARVASGQRPLTEEEKGAFKNNYAQTNGPRPKMYESARELNNDRQQQYIDNIGKTGLIHSVAETMANKITPVKDKDVEAFKKNYNDKMEEAMNNKESKEGVKLRGEDGKLTELGESFKKAYVAKNGEVGEDEEIKEKIHNKRVRNAKIVVGGVAIAAGVATGGTMGVLGAGGAGAMGGSAVYNEYALKPPTESKARKTMQKEFDTEKSRTERIAKLKSKRKALDEQKKTLTGKEEAKKEAEGAAYVKPEERKIVIDMDINNIKEKMRTIDKEISIAVKEKEKLEKEKTSLGTGPNTDIKHLSELSNKLTELEKKEKELNETKGKLPKQFLDALKEKEELESYLSIDKDIEDASYKIDVAEGRPGAGGGAASAKSAPSSTAPEPSKH